MESRLLTLPHLACCARASSTCDLFLWPQARGQGRSELELEYSWHQGYHSSRAEEAPLTPVVQAQGWCFTCKPLYILTPEQSEQWPS